MKTLFHFLAILPLPLLHGAGWLLGWLSFLGSREYRRRFLNNARRGGCGRRDILRAVAASGKLVAELPRLWFGRPVPVRWEGQAVLREALARGKGVLVVTPHLGCFEIVATAVAADVCPITVLYRPARKPWLSELIETARERPNVTAAPTTVVGVKKLLKTLKGGGVVGLLPDQVPPAGMGVWSTFFGSPAYTMTLWARLAQQTGAVPVLFWGERLSWGRGFIVRVSAWPGEVPPDAQQAADEVNRQMERLIGQCPGQYLWGYARYKQPQDGR